MSVLQDCSKLSKTSATIPGAIVFPFAQAELTAYYADWNNFSAGIGPDPGIMPPDATVGYSAIWPIAVQINGGWFCIDETNVGDVDRQTILQMATLVAMGAMAAYLAKVPNPPQMQYWICDDGRRVPRGSGQGIDPDLAKCIACGGTAVQCGGTPAVSQNGYSGMSPAVGIGIAAAAAIALWWVIK